MGLIIHAPNVHYGGGGVLLEQLVAALDRSSEFHLIVDARFRLPDAGMDRARVTPVPPTIPARLEAEWMLRSIARDGDVVLCFGNLPPLFRLKAEVLLYLQNRYLLGHRELRGFPWLMRLKLVIERFWFSWGVAHVNRILVQTPSMEREIRRWLGRDAEVVPIWAAPVSCRSASPARAPRDPASTPFLYVASGEPHKNHGNLIEAWKLLAEEGIFPVLYVTVSKERFPEVCAMIDDARRNSGAKIENTGGASRDELRELSRRCAALIFPSRLESLGLPLLEAQQTGLPVIASELDYVRDVLDPVESFDPDSLVSIARAVKRFLGVEEPALPVLSPEDFLRRILGKR